MFRTLPLAFGNMTGGIVFSTLFFVLLSFAALTSAIGLMEPAVAWSVERFGLTRRAAAIMIGIIIWFVGIGTALSDNVIADIKILGMNWFGAVDYLTTNIMLPLGGVLITVFAGWFMSTKSTSSELGGTGTGFSMWRFLARFVAPVGVLFVLADGTGLLDLVTGG